MRIKKKSIKACSDLATDAEVKKNQAVCYIKSAMGALALVDDKCCKESIANLSVVLVDLQDPCCEGENCCTEDEAEVFDNGEPDTVVEAPME